MNVLERTGEILDERGWCQGGFADHRGRVCLATALTLAAHEMGFENYAPAEQALRAEINASYPDAILNPWSLTGWQDSGARTISDVKLVVQRAAERLAA